MRQFVIVLTQENRLRFRLMKKEHGLLHDEQQRKSYAIVKEAYPTNWAGRWSRAYLVHEENAQTVQLETSEDNETVHGQSVEVASPLSLVTKIVLPTRRGEPGSEQQLVLTAETIYDRTMSAQVRRLGNRRIQWFHALLFACMGVVIGVGLTITAVSMGTNDAPTNTPPPTINSPTTYAPLPQDPEIVVSSDRAESGGRRAASRDPRASARLSAKPRYAESASRC